MAVYIFIVSLLNPHMTKSFFCHIIIKGETHAFERSQFQSNKEVEIEQG